MAKKVYVGLSGGVDSSVTAALLKRQGYEVIGVYMKNWSKDLPGFSCPWKADYQDAKRVAVQLNIPFKMYDFETQYRQKVVDYMINEYIAGRTPNPDIMCNQEVKFKLFLDTALSDGADLIATGHYARVVKPKTKNQKMGLFMAKDKVKDQTYFLYRMTEAALNKTLFPIGELKSKAEVRSLAKMFGLVTAHKKESMGICFVGKVGIRDFLVNELGPQETGSIIDQNDKIVGQHDGSIFYTIGQRHGLNTGGGLPYYVTAKDMHHNKVYVTTKLNDENLWQKQLKISDLHWINDGPNFKKIYQIRSRHRAPLIHAKLYKDSNSTLKILLEDEIKTISGGQSTVIYDNGMVLGGGIIY